MLPVGRREIVEGKQLLTIFDKAVGGLGILVLIGFDKGVKGFVGALPGLSHPDVVERFFGLLLSSVTTSAIC